MWFWRVPALAWLFDAKSREAEDRDRAEARAAIARHRARNREKAEETQRLHIEVRDLTEEVTITLCGGEPPNGHGGQA